MSATDTETGSGPEIGRVRGGLLAAVMVVVMAVVMVVGLAGSGAVAQVDPVPPGSLAELEQQAAAGQVGALVALGDRHRTGAGVLQDFRAAAALYLRAAEQGDAGAQARLGQAHHAGLGVVRDQAAALRWLRAAADQGDPEHLFNLGQVLEQGADGSSDPIAAAALYDRAAAAGHAEAAVSLGALYQNGTGQNEGGQNEGGQNESGQNEGGIPQDFARAYSLYQAPAEAGHPRALNNLGLLYVRGNGVAQDYETAAKLFAAAAERGLPAAMRNLATLFANGLGVPQSDTEAVAWQTRARQAGQIGQIGQIGQADPLVAEARGLCRADPRLVAAPQDAAALLRQQQAARGGDPVAQFQQGMRACLGVDPGSDPGPDLASETAPQTGPDTSDTPTPAPADARDLQQAARWFRAAAERGHGPAMANLGLLHMQGQGVAQDYVLSHMWLTLASSLGVEWSTAQSTALRQKMTVGQIDEAQSRALARWTALAAR